MKVDVHESVTIAESDYEMPKILKNFTYVFAVSPNQDDQI